MSGNKHFRRALVLGLVISALLIGVGFWQSVTMGIVCLVGCGALLAIFCLYTRNQTREIRRLSDYLTTLVNGTAPLLVPANNQEGELSLLENNIYKTVRKLQTQAELMQKDKTYLADALADVSHQLKTPITSMTVMTDLLLEEDLPAEKRLEFLKGISAQLEKMQWMITTLLKISKFDAGTAVLHKGGADRSGRAGAGALYHSSGAAPNDAGRGLPARAIFGRPAVDGGSGAEYCQKLPGTHGQRRYPAPNRHPDRPLLPAGDRRRWLRNRKRGPAPYL